MLIGIGYGALSGYAGGRTDQFMMRLIEIISGLPLIFFVMFLTVIFGRSESMLYVCIGAVGWLTMARIVRGQALSIPAAGLHRGGDRFGCLHRAHHRKTRGAELARPRRRVTPL